MKADTSAVPEATWCPVCCVRRGVDSIALALPGLVWTRCGCGHRWLRVTGVGRQDLPEESGSYIGDVVGADR